MNQRTNWAAIVYVRGPEGKTVLVLDCEKPQPHYWKLAGGRQEPGETPAGTASRELEEETGIKVSESSLVLLKEVDKRNHSLFVFTVTVENFNSLRSRGDEGERVAIFKEEEIPRMVDFFPPHRNYLEDLGIIAAT